MRQKVEVSILLMEINTGPVLQCTVHMVKQINDK